MLRILLTLILTFTSLNLYAKNPIATINTSLGIITLKLYPQKAPITVANFIDYARSGYYDGTIFHRVIETFMIQGGGFDKDFNKKQTKPAIENEAFNGLKNTRGTIAMARTSAPHSATSQFFINTRNNENLNFISKTQSGWGYTVFGEMTSGFDTLDKIASTETKNYMGYRNVPKQMIIINNIKIKIDKSTEEKEIENGKT